LIDATPFENKWRTAAPRSGNKIAAFSFFAENRDAIPNAGVWNNAFDRECPANICFSG
jgi:hypothetical protein